jgi:hypothetical protein
MLYCVTILCYQVRVCAFCSQQFNDPAAYRPTEEIKAAAYKRAVTEETRAKEKVLYLLLVVMYTLLIEVHHQ